MDSPAQRRLRNVIGLSPPYSNLAFDQLSQRTQHLMALRVRRQELVIELSKARGLRSRVVAELDLDVIDKEYALEQNQLEFDRVSRS